MSIATAMDRTATAAPSTAHVVPEGQGNRIAFDRVTVAYRNTVVLDNFSLIIEPGEFAALLGPSGSGKTTALRSVAGFVRPVSGSVSIGDEDVTTMPPYARGIGMVVQNYALFPHMTVAENVAFGLRARGAARVLIEERIRECLAMVDMSQYAKRYPRQLSGGQQQRVAIARALAIRPRVLLLDEPLSALDAQIRRNMVEELDRLHRELPDLTVLYVTHDQAEALTLADRIAIMRDGRLSAFGEARSLYHQPPNRFTAEFLGHANVIPVRTEALDGASGRMRVRFGAANLLTTAANNIPAGANTHLCVRPHSLKLEPAPDRLNMIEGAVKELHWQGHTQSIALSVNGSTIRVVSTELRQLPKIGEKLTVYFAAEDAVLIAEDGNA
jgi:2-aminoethylphosphonate transport system ATP-binding protein